MKQKNIEKESQYPCEKRNQKTTMRPSEQLYTREIIKKKKANSRSCTFILHNQDMVMVKVRSMFRVQPADQK